jgi:hypothetical protein
MKLLTDILDVMTDGYHKSGLDVQTNIFYILIHITAQNIVPISLFRYSIQSRLKNLQINPIPSTFIPSSSIGSQLHSPTSAGASPPKKLRTGFNSLTKKPSNWKLLTI